MKIDTLERVSSLLWFLTCHVMLCVHKQILRWLPAGSFPVKSTSVLLLSLNLKVSLRGWEKRIVVNNVK